MINKRSEGRALSFSFQCLMGMDPVMYACGKSGLVRQRPMSSTQWLGPMTMSHVLASEHG